MVSFCRWTTAVAGLVAVAWACSETIAPPSNAIELSPPARYRAWWALVESCSGHTGNFGAVRWYVVPVDTNGTFEAAGQDVGGAFYPGGNQIAIVEYLRYDGALVRHEMLHALMPTTNGHPRDEFLGRCGDIVECVAQCITDAGGPPDWSDSAPVVAASSLTVGLVLSPNPESQRADSGWLPITITVTNNASQPVRVAIPGITANNVVPWGFAYRITPLAGGAADSAGYTQFDASDVVFAPSGTAGSTRRLVFDNAPTLPLQRVVPGDYDVTGGFVSVTSEALPLRVDP